MFTLPKVKMHCYEPQWGFALWGDLMLVSNSMARGWYHGKPLVFIRTCVLPPPLAFIFYNHTHGREMIDVFVHQLLVFTTILAGLVTFMEFLTKNNVLLELLRSSLVILQGTWFWQVSWDLELIHLVSSICKFSS